MELTDNRELAGNVQQTATPWEELGISNDFMFGKIMRKPEICKELLQIILPELQIARIEYPEEQKTINVDRDARSVRLDVYVQDNNEIVYNIEMQVQNTGELPKRLRYYQSMIDLQLIDKGQPYSELNQSYIIFICPFDVFGKGRHKYTFKPICEEDTGIFLEDGTAKIFLNALGEMDDVSEDLKAFLDYVSGKKPDNDFVERLEQEVREARRNREWRHEYMTLLMRDQENLRLGEQKGIFRSLDSFLKRNPTVNVDTAAEMLGFSCEELEAYKRDRKYDIVNA